MRMRLITSAITPGLLSLALGLGIASIAQAQDDAPPPAPASAILNEQGTLQPVQAEYTFAGQAGDAIVVAMNSPIFDSTLTLFGPNGNEVASNDDYARSLNSKIVVILPEDGTYRVRARSFTGDGGDYTITVTPATAFDRAYAAASGFYLNGDFEQALVALDRAIRLDATQPVPLLDRGDIFYAQGRIDEATADYRQAIALYEQQGDTVTANILREQLAQLEQSVSP